ncbi:MAG: hypothetical protein DHS20C15_12580 [Planctomycetota bacterium]|nr:MAG: hypothetical protein DHS20C15_12580 [Planctomycetota bacterium]
MSSSRLEVLKQPATTSQRWRRTLGGALFRLRARARLGARHGAVALLTLSLGVACGDAPARSESPTPRVVLITLDTLRADALLDENPSMPKLAARAQQGLNFTDFWSACTTTQPAHASLFTGLHPWEHGVHANGLVLADDALTVAEIFQLAGWRTEAVVASFPLEKRFGFTQGFDAYDDEFLVTLKGEWAGEDVDNDRFYTLAPTILERAGAVVERTAGEPLFLWTHAFDPHAPYGDLAGKPELHLRALFKAARNAPSEMPATLARARALYNADARALDDALDVFLDTLLDDPDHETHVVITADHGESFGEDMSFGHGRRVSRVQLQVPCIVLSSKVSAAVRDDTAGSVDIPHTLLELAELANPLRTNGRSLLSRGSGGELQAVGMRQTFPPGHGDPQIDGTELSIEGPNFFVVREGRLHGGDANSVKSEGEPLPEAAQASLRERFATWTKLVEAGAAQGLNDPETMEAMKQLGYVGEDG